MSRLYESNVTDDTYETASQFMSVIFDNCGPYLKEIRSSNPKFLVSGRRSDYSWFEKDVRADRKPVDINIEIHNDIDALFQLKFGYPARSSSIFCTTRYDITGLYGKTYLIFPKGSFKFLWSPTIYDLYVYFGKKSNYSEIKRSNGILQLYVDEITKEYKGTEREKDIPELANERYAQFLQDIVDTYSKNNFRAALDSQHEVMINCKSYYAVEYTRWHKMFETFFKYMGNNMPTIDIFKEWFYEIRRVV
jgi:hypothetical protein